MKSQALDRFRRKLQADEPVYGLWVTLEAAAVSDIAAGLGLDWIVIDAGDGHLDWAEILEHMRATVRSNTVALIRLADPSPGLVKRALDIGADGVVIPGIEAAAQLQSVVQWARRHGSAEHGLESNANPLVVPMIETAYGGHNIHELLGVEGADVFFCDPSNYSADMGIVRDIRNQGKHAGVVALTEEALTSYRDAGFRVLGVGFDSGIIFGGIRKMLDVVGGPSNKELASAPDSQLAGKLLPAASRKETRN